MTPTLTRRALCGAGLSPIIACAGMAAAADGPTSVTLEAPTSAYLIHLREAYDLDQVVAGASSPFERACRLTHWVHGRFAHGQSRAKASDAMAILAEAAADPAAAFRCTEFAEVLAACCTAIGLPARAVSLFLRDAAQSGAAHVAVEAWDEGRRSWFHADAQFDVLALADGRPANLLEFGAALDTGRGGIASGSGVSLERYADFVRPYIFYLDVWRDGGFSPARKAANAGREVLYVPDGAPDLASVQGWPLRASYVRSAPEFYAPPRLV